MGSITSWVGHVALQYMDLRRSPRARLEIYTTASLEVTVVVIHAPFHYVPVLHASLLVISLHPAPLLRQEGT